MKKTLLKLIDESGASIDRHGFDALDFSTNDDDFFLHLNTLFNDSLIDYSFKRAVISDVKELPKNFICLEPKPFLVKRSGFHYTSDNNNVDEDKLINREIVYLIEKPKIKTAKEFVDILFDLYPKVNFFLLLSVPFVLIPAFYANLFNTRMIFNDFVYTLVFVTSVFVSLWLIDYFLKRFIKKKSLASIDKSALKIEKYFFYLMPYIKSHGLITKMKMLESNRKVIWESSSGVLIDLASFLLLIFVLFIIVGNLALVLFFFYIVIILFAVLMRYKNYKLYIEVEAVQQDLLIERLSYYQNNRQLAFFDMSAMLTHFGGIYKQGSKVDHDVSNFNFNWDEFVRFSSFFATFVLFSVIFFGAKADPSIFNVLIALLIINGRVSASVVGLVTKTFHLLVSTYHIKLSISDIFEKIDPNAFHEGFNLGTLNKITLKELSVSIEGKGIVSGINQEFKPGYIYGIAGGVGQGKSTLLKCLTKSHLEYNGSILFNDAYGVKEIDRGFFSKKVVYIDPMSDFIKGSIFYNFDIRGCRDKERIAKVLSEIFPDVNIDYEFVFQQDVNHIPMSTGQKRKLLLSMALNKDKSLVVIDEALINIAYNDAIAIIKFIKEEMKASIVFIVSHDKNILNCADYVYEIKNMKLSLLKSSIIKIDRRATKVQPKND